MKVQIALVVGDNGKYYPTRFEGASTDWGFASDCLGIFNEKTGVTTYPNQERRYIITAEVDLPEITAVAAVSIEAA